MSLEAKLEYSAVPPKPGDILPSISEFIDGVTPLMQTGGHRVQHITPDTINRNAYYLHCERAALIIGTEQFCKCVAGATFLSDIKGAVQCMGLLSQHSDACIQLQLMENLLASQREPIDAEPTLLDNKPHGLAEALEQPRLPSNVHRATESSAACRPSLPTPAQRPELPDTPFIRTYSNQADDDTLSDSSPSEHAAQPSLLSIPQHKGVLSKEGTPSLAAGYQMSQGESRANLAALTRDHGIAAAEKRFTSGDSSSQLTSCATRVSIQGCAANIPIASSAGVPRGHPLLMPPRNRPAGAFFAVHSDQALRDKAQPPMVSEGERPKRSPSPTAVVPQATARDDIQGGVSATPRPDAVQPLGSMLLSSLKKVDSVTTARNTTNQEPLAKAEALSKAPNALGASATQPSNVRSANHIALQPCWSEDSRRRMHTTHLDACASQRKLPSKDIPRSAPPNVDMDGGVKALLQHQTSALLPNFKGLEPSGGSTGSFYNQQGPDSSRPGPGNFNASPTATFPPSSLVPSSKSATAKSLKPISAKAQCTVANPPETVNTLEVPDETLALHSIFPDALILHAKVKEADPNFRSLPQSSGNFKYYYYKCKNFEKAKDDGTGGTECPRRVSARQPKEGGNVQITAVLLEHNEACKLRQASLPKRSKSVTGAKETSVSGSSSNASDPVQKGVRKRSAPSSAAGPQTKKIKTASAASQTINPYKRKSKSRSVEIPSDDGREDALASRERKSVSEGSPDDDNIVTACDSDSDDDEPIAAISARHRAPALGDDFASDRAFCHRIQEWTGLKGHSAWTRSGASSVTMVCANHRGPPVRPDQKKRGTSCKYTVIARRFGGKWQITELDLVHNDACVAKVAESRRKSMSSSSNPTKSATASSEHVQVTAAILQTRKKRIAESDEEEEEEEDLSFNSSSSSKRQRLQSSESFNNAPEASSNPAFASSLTVVPHLLSAPTAAPNSSMCAAAHPSGRNSIAGMEEPNVSLSPDSPPSFRYEPSEVSSESSASSLSDMSTASLLPINMLESVAEASDADMTGLTSMESEKCISVSPVALAAAGTSIEADSGGSATTTPSEHGASAIARPAVLASPATSIASVLTNVPSATPSTAPNGVATTISPPLVTAIPTSTNQATEPALTTPSLARETSATDDLPAEVHEWRDFLLANGIESVADLRSTFYGDGSLDDSEVKGWLAWVAEDPKTSLPSRSHGWRFMKSLQKYFTNNP